MELGKRLRRWWHRVRGRDDEPATASPIKGAAGEHAMPGIRPVKTAPASDELKLAAEGTPGDDPAHKSHPATAGFDPYSSDAGYAKPRGWEEIQHK